jgi:DNA-binding NarL/FixJ family response regulator
MTRILLVDDHPVVRQGIKQVLSGAFHPALVGEAANAEEGLSEVRNTEWDVMVLDLTLPGMSGMDLLKDLRRERPALPVLVLSMHPPDQFARRVMNAGAPGYLTKDSARPSWSAVSESSPAALNQPGGRRRARPAPLANGPAPARASPTAMRVLRMIASGLTVSQISRAR